MAIEVFSPEEVRDLELEQDVLSALLLDPEAAVRAAPGIPEEIFSLERHRQILRAIQAAISAGGVPDLQLVSRHLPDGLGLLDLMGLQARAVPAVNLPAMVARLREVHGRAAALREVVGIAQELHAGGRPEAAASRMERARRILLDAAAHRWALSLQSGAELAADYIEGRIGRPEMLVPGLLPKAGLAILAGKEKIGKSILAQNLALAVACGGVFLRQRLEQGTVIYIAAEGGKAPMAERLIRIMGSPSLPAELLLYFGQPPQPLDRPEGAQWLEGLIRRAEARVVVIDTLARCMSPLDWNDYGRMAGVVGRLEEMAISSGVLILAVHHVRKAEAEDAFEGVLGTRGVTASASAVVVMSGGRFSRYRWLEGMGREFQGGEFVVRWDDDFRLDLESDWIQALPDALREVYEALQAYPDGATAGDIASSVGISMYAAHDRLHRLAGKGLVERRTRTSGRGRPEVVWKALPARGKEEKR